MKKRILSGIIIILLVLIMSSCSSRQEEIGILDMQRLLAESQRAAELQDELSSIGDQLEKDYNQKKEELSGDKEKEELDKVYQEYVENKDRLEGTLNKEIKEVMAGISEEKNLGIVLSNSGVIAGGIDVTDEVIKKLDEKKSGESSGSDESAGQDGAD